MTGQYGRGTSQAQRHASLVAGRLERKRAGDSRCDRQRQFIGDAGGDAGSRENRRHGIDSRWPLGRFRGNRGRDLLAGQSAARNQQGCGEAQV